MNKDESIKTFYNFNSSKNLDTNHKIKEPSETNINYVKTNNKLNNFQQLLDFLSDKNKFSLNSNFDDKGSEEFLCGKSDAMKKIELNEYIFEEENTNKKIDKPPKIEKVEENANNIISDPKNKNEEALDKKNEKEETVTQIKERKHLKKIKEIKNNNIIKENISFDSIITVNSKLFNNYKDYQKCQKLLSNDDIPLVEDIIVQLNMERK